MARKGAHRGGSTAGKKAGKELTVEEKLEQALVPEDEQPYAVPGNWCWTRLGRMTEVIGGGTPSSKVKEYYENGTIPWICPADLSGYNDIYISHGAKNITKLGLEKSSAQLMPAGTVCLSSRAPIGYVVIARNELSTNQGFKSFLPAPCYMPGYLYWYLRGNKELLENYASGTTFLELSGSKAALVVFPLPPLAEQQRIVDRIESLFAKLDEAKEKAQAVVDGFELRKSAILHKAFSGELTEQWRNMNGRSNSDWRIIQFGEVAVIKSNLVEPANYQDFPHIAPDNIEKKTGILLEYHTIAEDGVKSGKHLFHAGQILYSKIRPYLSKVVIVDFDGLCSADMYPIDAKEDTRYLWYYMLSDEFLEQASNAGSRSVLPKINQKELSKVMVRMTSLIEQQVIVKILDDIFEKERQAKEAAEAVLDQIDIMKKSILARAFRGELGTNDLKEESAIELLKKFLA